MAGAAKDRTIHESRLLVLSTNLAQDAASHPAHRVPTRCRKMLNIACDAKANVPVLEDVQTECWCKENLHLHFMDVQVCVH